MGFVLSHPRPEGLSDALKRVIPETLFVEIGRGSMDLYTDSPPNHSIPKRAPLSQ